MAEITTLKMVSGEEVICKLIEVDDESGVFTIESPLVLQVMPAPGGGFGLGLIPWIHSKKHGTLEVAAAQVMCLAETDKEVVDGYLSQTSGIQLASAGSVLHS